LLEIIVRILFLQVFIILRFYADCERMFFAGGISSAGAAAAAIKLSRRQ
jgi:hypothetical protein